MGNIGLGIGFIIVGLVGGFGVGFGMLAPIVQTGQFTEMIGKTIASIVCILAAIALVIGGILKLAGVW